VLFRLLRMARRLPRSSIPRWPTPSVQSSGSSPGQPTCRPPAKRDGHGSRDRCGCPDQVDSQVRGYLRKCGGEVSVAVRTCETGRVSPRCSLLPRRSHCFPWDSGARECSTPPPNKNRCLRKGQRFFLFGSVFHSKTPTLYRLWHHAVGLCLMSQSTPLPIAQ
jgi:hypothetical protein